MPSPMTQRELDKATAMQKAMDKGRKKKPRERGKKERTVEDWANDYAWVTYGVDNLKLNTFGHNSYPDRVYFFPMGRPLFIEFKKLGKKPSESQRHTMDLLREKGYSVEACDSRELAQTIIDCHWKKVAEAMDTQSLPATSGALLPKKRMCGDMGRPRRR